jgi:hypothetical protein
MWTLSFAEKLSHRTFGGGDAPRRHGCFPSACDAGAYPAPAKGGGLKRNNGAGNGKIAGSNEMLIKPGKQPI